MSYLVLARRFRPQSFQDIVGQEHVTRTLENAIATDRVAHAFLFAGARGVGKTTTARVLAKALNCANGPTAHPCGTCDQCQSITAGQAVDVHEIDGASNNSVDDVRALRETVPYRPASGRFKVYIVDEVHMLSTSAFNALLKTLEEPPAHVKFVFATTEVHKIPVTIISRCQRYDFRLVNSSVIRQRLADIVAKEQVEADDQALTLLAREAQGSMRDALSLLDQALAFNNEKLEGHEVAKVLGAADRQSLFEISKALLERDPAGALRAVESAAQAGCDLSRLCYDLLAHLRNVVVLGQCPNDHDLFDLSDDERQHLSAQVQGHALPELHRLFLLFAKATEEIVRSPQPRLLLEMTLARLASLEPMRSLELLAQQLEDLAARGAPPPERKAPPQGGRPPPPPSTPPPGRSPATGPAPPPGRPPATGSAPRDASATATIRSRPPAQGHASAVPAAANRQPSAATSPPRAPNRPSPITPPQNGKKIPTGPGANQERWKSLLSQIQRTSAPLYHVLRYAQAQTLGDEQLELTLPNEPFFQAEAQNPQSAEAVRTAWEQLFGTSVQVSFTVASAEGASLAARSHIEHATNEHNRKRDALEHAIVRAALSEFEGARIKKIELFDGRKK